jgi:phage terminase large subunit GpA-like protein
MPDEIWLLIPALGALAAMGLLPLAGRFVRQPCPHCGRRASRTVLDVQSIAGVPDARSITYTCRACGGAMRYARRPTGQEFWEPIPLRSDGQS